jgi:hypothetical protein
VTGVTVGAGRLSEQSPKLVPSDEPLYVAILVKE